MRYNSVNNKSFWNFMGFLTVVSLCVHHGFADEITLSSQPPEASQQVQVKLEIRGEVNADLTGESPRAFPMEVDGEFSYRERTLRSSKSWRTIRHYQKANAKIDLGQGTKHSKLSEENQWVIADRSIETDRTRFLTSSLGLTQSEHELLLIPANSLVFDRFLEAKSVEQNKSWQPDDRLLANILSIESITENNVELTITGVRKGIVSVTIKGNAAGLVNDSETGFKLNGLCKFDLESGFTRSLRLTLNESRNIGQIVPGYDAIIKLEMKVSRPEKEVLPGSEIANRKLNKQKWTDFLQLRTEDKQVEIRHSSNWRMILNERSGAVLRYVKDNLLLAQCNVQALGRIPTANAYTMSAFQADVKQTIAQSGEIVGQKAWDTDRKLKVLRIDVEGVADGVDVKWLYYHVAQPDGQRASFVITFDSEVEEEFAGAEIAMIESLVCSRKTAKAQTNPTR